MAEYLNVLGIGKDFGLAFGSAFLVIMALTVMQLVLRFMRVASAELLGGAIPAFRNVHFGTIVGVLLTLLLMWTGFWSRIWILFGGSNQLFAGLALVLITIWLARRGSPTSGPLWPAVFMYVSTVAASDRDRVRLLPGGVRARSQGRFRVRQHDRGGHRLRPGDPVC